MNRLSTEKRARLLHWMVEGVSQRAISRVENVSMRTLSKLLRDAGEACRKHHDETVRKLPRKRLFECDETWSYVYAKDKNAAEAEPWDEVGTMWTWIALDQKSRMVVSYHISKKRDTKSAVVLMEDLKSRLDMIPDISADELQSYRKAVDRVFGRRHCRLTQCKGDGTTAHVERYNLKIRMGNKRCTRRTSAFSKTLKQHIALMHVHTTYNNFCWQHATLRVSPAMAAGVDDTLRDVEWIIGLIDANAPKRKRPGPRKGTKYRSRQRRKG